MAEDRPVIAHVLHRLYLAGAEVLAADLARRMRGRYTFVFFCLDEVGPLGEQLRGEGFAVLNLGRRPGVDRAVARRMRSLIAEHRVLLLHAHQYTPFFYAAAGRGLLRPGGPAILFTEHGRHYPDQRKLKRVLANRLLLRRRDRVTAVGEFVKQALVANEGIAAKRIEVIRNGIDPAAFAAGDRVAARAALRRELNLPADAAVVLHVARFHPVKDHATGLRAFAHAAKRAPMAVLLLAGDGEKRGAIESLARELGVAERVRFLGVRSDVARLVGGSDVFMLSSVSEGISVTLLEAMAASLPIAATAVGGNGEVVAHDHTGLLSPRGDADALGENLARLLNDADLRARFGEAGRARLLQHFTQQQMHDAYATVYDRMLSVGREA